MIGRTIFNPETDQNKTPYLMFESLEKQQDVYTRAFDNVNEDSNMEDESDFDNGHNSYMFEDESQEFPCK